jgi:FkbM family methyltransferase
MGRIPAVGTKLLKLALYVQKRLLSYVQALGWRQGIRFAFLDLSGHERLKAVNLYGSTFWTRFGRRHSDFRTLLHVWDELCYQMDLDPAPEVIVDAGANVGYSVTWFADRYPSARIIAIEPDPGNLQLLRKNTAHLTSVTILEAALAASPGWADLIDTGQGPWAMRVGPAGDGAGAIVGRVRCVTVDEVMQEHGIDRIGLLKIDIEGGEVEVLGASDGWIDRVDAVVAELHDRFRPGATRAFVAATSGFRIEYMRGEDSFAIR